MQYFNNEKYEVNRYDTALQQYEKASIKVATSLAFLNSGQNLIFSSALTGMMFLAANGVAQDAIYQKMPCPKHSHAGVRRSKTQSRSQGYPRSLVVRLVQGLGFYQRNAHTHALQSATLGLVHLALRWDQPSIAFVGRNQSLVDASILTMRMVGVVVKFAESSCLAAFIHVLDLATTVYVGLARCESRLAAIAARFKRTFFAVIEVTKKRAA